MERVICFSLVSNQSQAPLYSYHQHSKGVREGKGRRRKASTKQHKFVQLTYFGVESIK